jgi:hypothetical protein
MKYEENTKMTKEQRHNILFELVADQEGDRGALAEDIGCTLKDFGDVVPEDDGLLGDAVESNRGVSWMVFEDG